MERRPANGQPAPNADAWHEHSAVITGAVIAYERGAVQFVGRAPLAIGETVIAVPFGQLFTIVGQVLGMLDPSHPAHAVARAALFPPPRVE